MGEVEGEARDEYFTVTAKAGAEILWDTVHDEGPGQIAALAALGVEAIVGFGTLFEGNTSRCYVHRRKLDGSYGGGDVQIVFPEHECTAVDIVTVEEAIYLVAQFATGDGPRWRLASMQWGGQPGVIRTGVKDEVAHALARSASGEIFACGTGPSPAPVMDAIDGRVWPLNGSPLELDYVPAPGTDHTFNETVTDCAFRGDQLVLVAEVFGQHDDGMPKPPKRKRPVLIEIEGQGEPHWIVQGLGPGKITQGGASTVDIDDQGRAIVGGYTCTDACQQQPELWIFEPGGSLAWQLTLPAQVSVPFGLTWSPAGYVVIAGALGDGLSSQFLLQAYVPGNYAPAWTFAKGQVGFNVAFAVVAVPGVVVGGGLGVNGYPAFAFVTP